MTSTSVRKYTKTVAGMATIFLALAGTASAQNPAGSVGVGGQLGEPSGVTVKLYQQSDFAYEILGAWDLSDFFFVNGHALFERPVPNVPIRYYVGPGVLAGIREGGDEGSDFVIGISGQFGINYFVERYEVFLHLTPRLGVIPDTEGDVGGGIGLRYYF